ncbi:Appr-1-p processing protein [Streptomyces sp. 3MP-14]|uniref:Appr-1-p processing protein n=1 Tax=Streptomyces mimosae TaxID=2586635 RepID=A0A5N6AC02_9ACTN|nr:MULTISPECIES: macro domain-containing protein [Streptomyces]KAB8166354.1 Appr-1-p processing protein [Streptomyces mimosae]KAB8174147.1 Appr-1-p processing protein [Streptomyces sp. 3MP-14]
MGLESELSLPAHAALVEDLRALRRPGLANVRVLGLPALRAAAETCGLSTGPDDVPAGIEELLRQAVRRLGDQDALGRAAARTYGLVPGLRGATAFERRRAAAEVVGVSTETFRRRQEVQVVDQTAEAVLGLCRERVRRRNTPVSAASSPAGAGGTGGTGGTGEQRPPEPESHRGTTQRDDDAPPFTVETTVADAPTPFVLHVSPVDLLRDVDVIVSSENVYLEMSKTFWPTLSGTLRRACAVRDASGEIVDDVLVRELNAWVRRFGRPGLPVRPGTVAATSSGAMAEQGVRRIYHAAVAVPLAGRDGYEVAPANIARAVREAFALARAERAAFDPPLRSICFPLMGSGRGGVSVESSASWIGWAIHEELTRDPDWTVHLVVRNRVTARAITNLPDL